jgi:hypothetical protein
MTWTLGHHALRAARQFRSLFRLKTIHYSKTYTDEVSRMARRAPNSVSLQRFKGICPKKRRVVSKVEVLGIVHQIMKFAKVLAESSERFENDEYRVALAPYKRWKKAKVAKVSDAASLTSMLSHECRHIDSVFKHYWKQLFKGKQGSGKARFVSKCCLSKVVHEDALLAASDARELLTYAQLNAQAVYKICKKWRKRGDFDAGSFYKQLRDRHEFAFMGSAMLTMLRWKVMQITEEETHGTEETECPVCLEPLIGEGETTVVLYCGHPLCWTCLDKMTRIDAIKGTVNNRLLTASYRMVCPMCRLANPIRHGLGALVCEL